MNSFSSVVASSSFNLELTGFKKYKHLPKECNQDREDAYKLIKTLFDNQIEEQSGILFMSKESLQNEILLRLQQDTSLSREICKVAGKIAGWSWHKEVKQVLKKGRRYHLLKSKTYDETRQLKKLRVVVYLYCKSRKNPAYIPLIIQKASGAKIRCCDLSNPKKAFNL